jgi:sugar phosphate isomerase/epimerase
MTTIGTRAFEDNVQDVIKLDADLFEIAVRPEHSRNGELIPETNLKSYDILKDRIIGVHGGILYQGVNLMNRARNNVNEKAIELALKAADRFNCKYIVFHPGYVERNKAEDCSLENLCSLMKNYADKRLLLETIPVFAYKERHIFPIYHVDSWKRLQDKTGKNIMLDIGHAAITTRATKQNPVDYINSLITELGIQFMHIADNDSSKDGYEDSHLSIGKGNVPIEQILKQNKDRISFATIEVDNTTQKDIELVRSYFK